MEIQVLVWYLQKLIKEGIPGVEIKTSDIGIITPYRRQVHMIQKRLSSRSWSYDIEVGSVEQYQGREKSIIIVSMVKSFLGLGFLRNPRVSLFVY